MRDSEHAGWARAFSLIQSLGAYQRGFAAQSVFNLRSSAANTHCGNPPRQRIRKDGRRLATIEHGFLRAVAPGAKHRIDCKG
jgi:hypothetical protein